MHKEIKTRLDYITTEEEYLFWESVMDGGLTYGSKRLSKANNLHIPETFDPAKPSSFILYLDCNALYSKALSFSLPASRFCFLEANEREEFCRKLENGWWKTWMPERAYEGEEVDENGELIKLNIGFFIECDLEIDLALHDRLNSYTPLFEKK